MTRTTTIRPKPLVAVLGLLVAIALAGGWLLSRGDGPALAGGVEQPPSAAAPADLAERTIQAGEVQVRITPTQLDRAGAVFEIVFTTHTGSLDLDPATAAGLRINDVAVTGGTWTGSGPGGHHRKGALRFATTVPAGAAVELRLTGLSTDVVAAWTAP